MQRNSNFNCEIIKPRLIIVMGVASSGKTCLGQKLAEIMELSFFDADDYHSQANLKKMASGHALEDEDRWPWLESLAELIHGQIEDGKHMLLACSALKERYRQTLTAPCAQHGIQPVLLYLRADFPSLVLRLKKRAEEEGHFFQGEDLLARQFADLEEPKACTESYILHCIQATASPKSVLEQSIRALQW